MELTKIFLSLKFQSQSSTILLKINNQLINITVIFLYILCYCQTSATLLISFLYSLAHMLNHKDDVEGIVILEERSIFHLRDSGNKKKLGNKMQLYSFFLAPCPTTLYSITDVVEVAQSTIQFACYSWKVPPLHN